MTEHTWPQVLTALVNRTDLSQDAAAWAMSEILDGNASPVQVAGFMVALRAKGETVEELGSLASTMLDHARPIELDRECVDIVGSGGDRANTVNISTMAAIVAAAAGARVVKHGNRAASSACGTADCLEALGVALDVAPAAQADLLAREGIVFLMAPYYHPSLRFAGPPRKELAISTTFNFLGPLANPARPLAQAVGVADRRMAALMAGVLADRGSRGLVFHGGDGLDELTTTTASDVWVIGDGRVVEAQLDPAELGIARAQAGELVGAGPEVNAQVARDVLGGGGAPAVRDIVILNAAAALLAYRGPELDADLAPQLAGCLDDARSAIDSGAATDTLTSWAAATQVAPRL